MASKEDKHSEGDPDDLSFLRTVWFLKIFPIFFVCFYLNNEILQEDYVCLNCSVITQNGINRRMALAAEAFGNNMCFLEDITLEVRVYYFRLQLINIEHGYLF